MTRYSVEPLPTNQKIYLSPRERFDAERTGAGRISGGPGNTPFLPDAVVIDTQAARPQYRAVAVAHRLMAMRIADALNKEPKT